MNFQCFIHEMLTSLHVWEHKMFSARDVQGCNTSEHNLWRGTYSMYQYVPLWARVSEDGLVRPSQIDKRL